MCNNVRLSDINNDLMEEQYSTVPYIRFPVTMKILLTPLLATKRYCALSNLHNLDAIRSMIDPNGANIYGSTGTDKIMTGIQSFHEKYTDVFWIFKSYKIEENPSKVLIDFDRYWTVKEEDSSRIEIQYSSASEVIEFNDESRIISIAYSSPPTEPALFGPSYPHCRAEVLDECRTTMINTE